MSIHSSLKTSGSMRGSRSVWTRVERLAILKKEGRWHEGDPVHGLPKVRTQFKVKSKKQLKAEAAAAREEKAAAKTDTAG
ncbi:MAG: small basic protein [Planctomycetota bacterium]